MSRVVTSVDSLRGRRPEWEPWLLVIDEAMREAASGGWQSAVPADTQRAPSSPWIDGTTIVVDPGSVKRYAKRLFDTASRIGTASMTTLKGATKGTDPIALFEASLRRDPTSQLAAACHADAEAFQAVVSLVAWPFLQACNRRCASSQREAWTHGYCPVCAGWPVFAEVRGIERSRYLRCGCGAAWLSQPLLCAHCGNSDHDALRSLMPESADRAGSIEACRKCSGYVKVFTRLQGCAPEAVMLEDLASVDLDVAAIEQGYLRRSGLACPLDVTVVPASSAGRFLSWNP